MSPLVLGFPALVDPVALVVQVARGYPEAKRRHLKLGYALDAWN